MPYVIEGILLTMIVAGFGLAVAYLRAEYVLHRGFKAAEHKKLTVQRELRASRLTLRPANARMARHGELA
jgi:hypothetical protein